MARLARLLVALCWFVGLGAVSGRSAPNVVILFADDLGYGDIGPYGAEGYSTPNLDRMAAEGIRFTDFYVPAPVCTPSRAALLTGSYPMRVGLANRVLFPFSQHGLNPDEITLAELLKGQGYRTMAVGKWHLGHQKKFLPTRQGFDEYLGIPYSNDMGSHRYPAQGFVSPPLPILHNEDLVDQHPSQALLTQRWTAAAVDFIERSAGSPFFLYLAHSMPHLPIDASSDFKGGTEHGLYGDVIEELDWSVGQIFAALARAGVDDDTLVVFTSDNGPVVRPARQLGHQSGSAGPLRGSKNTTWEGGMREPGLMRWPAKIPAGAVCRELATTMDLLPTIAKLAGATPPADRIIDGKDIAPLLFAEPGARSPHEAFYYYRDERLQAVRSGRWKLHTYRPEWNDQPHEPLLFDLETDVGETTDVAAKNPEVVARLQVLADKARADLGDAARGRRGQNARPPGRL
ncbi:MAG: sulfatase-like hydrolase/transferase [Acidobacteria bacterium]|nr:sulfatase-like hydrolase/transferase [Acidobacteriota bacterium]